MTQASPHPGLLPTGLADLLPPMAAAAAAAAARVLGALGAHGYDQATPPMLEFEDSFLVEAAAPLQRETFRMMDPASQRMLALRSDLTPQIARIAATRLAKAPRPLRLCYLGTVLRVSGERAGGDRQFTQAGAELIGARQAEADAEIVLLAARALAAVGVPDVVVDLNAPRMASDVAVAMGLAAEDAPAMRDALDRKDAAEARRLAPPGAGDVLTGLIDAGGEAETAFAAVAKLDLPAAAVQRIARLKNIVALIRAEAPNLPLTIDFVEYRGFDYHTGVAFSLFAKGHKGEIGRGGRYRAPPPDGGDPAGEPAVGFSLFMEAACAAATPTATPLKLYLPYGAGGDARLAAMAAGHVVVAGLAPETDILAEARRLGCDGAWRDGAAIILEKDA